jgi:hypothetical protein
MQAVTIVAFGDIDVLSFGEVLTPYPKANHLLIGSRLSALITTTPWSAQAPSVGRSFAA